MRSVSEAHEFLGTPSSPQPASKSSPAPTRAPTSRAPRGAKKVALPSAKLEPVEGSSDPLGPLGIAQSPSGLESPPSPPLKEQSLPIRNAQQTQSSPPSKRNTTQSRHGAEDEDAVSQSGQRLRSQASPQPGAIEGPRRPTQPSVSIEQAARPTFNITVGDPHKVGDPISSHIVYQVRTKVRLFR